MSEKHEPYDEKELKDASPLEKERSPTEGVVVDVESLPEPILDKHGIRLHPQPTTDPLDPLNWSKTRKHSMLAIVMSLYFLFTFLTTATVPSFPGLQEQLQASAAQINWTVAIPALGLAIGPVVWSSIADAVGRRVVFIGGTVIALAATIGAAKPQNYGGYMAARFFQGLGLDGLNRDDAIRVSHALLALRILTVDGNLRINDMFYEHERGQKVGLWVIAIDMGLLVGPLIGGFMDLVSTEWIQWLIAILFAVVLLAEIAFLPESLYPRSRMLYTHNLHPNAAANPTGSSTSEEKTEVKDLSDHLPKRTKALPFVNVAPIPGIKHPAPWDSLLRFFLTWPFPAVSLTVCLYCFGWYWWILCVITEIPAAYESYSPQIQGLFFIGLILGTGAAELFFSGTLSDWIVLKLSKRNIAARDTNNSNEHGTTHSPHIRIPEHRLYLLPPASLLTCIGLLLWGISIDRSYHWIVGQIAFFLIAAGIQTGNTLVCAYIIDCYPLQSMSVVTFYAVLLNFSAFVSPFFVAPWVEANGFTNAFVAMGLFTLGVGGGGAGLVIWFGKRLRAVGGDMSWVNPEFEN
ncbi:MAG: hypothetical protein M1831_003093 [Alyxoria varia]|nr:MAG: hypothetical protein M1831_003093 [Alyxoria varia]